MADDFTPPAGAPPAGTPPAGTPPAAAPGAPATGTPPEGTPPAGTPPAGTPPAGQQTWPENWREAAAKDDQATIARLKRYQDPGAALSALSQLQERISKGELRSAMPKNATPDQVKAWRQENGIPDEWKGYDLTMPDGKKVDLEERPDIASFLEYAHTSGMTQAHVKAALEWNVAYREEEDKARHEVDETVMRATVDQLRQDWGPNYYAHMNRVHQILDVGPPGMKDILLNGRMADGTPIGSHPDVLKWLVERSMAEDPSGTLLTESGTSRMGDVETRIAEIEGLMRTNRTAYNRDVKVQDELRGLYDARSRLQARNT